jgi:hypothetical protein
MASASAVNDRDGRDAKLLARAQHAQRDLAAIGNQDFFEHGVVLVRVPDAVQHEVLHR